VFGDFKSVRDRRRRITVNDWWSYCDEVADEPGRPALPPKPLMRKERR
jgi:hypothetical protein